jgi:phosphoglycerate dehydrogenase-like enzyme
VDVVIVSPMRPEHAERIAASDERIELTYLPDLLPTARWNGDTNGEGGVALDDPRWKHALEGAEVAFGIPGNSGEGLIDLVRRAPNLQWVQARNAGGGEQLGAALQISAEDAARVKVTTSSGVHAGPLAEFAILGMLAFAKDLPQHQRWQRERHWPEGQTPVGELRGQTLLLVGVGAIGTETARLAGAFGMHVLAVKRTLEGGVPHVDELHPVSELRALVGRADAIVVTLPGTDATRGLLDAETLAAVKPGAVLVNVGRGTVIDEAALAERLQDGTLKGAALDVFAEEPLPQDSPLWGLENVIVTPHDIALVPAEEPRIVDLFIDNLRRRRAGEPLRNALDPEVLY